MCVCVLVLGGGGVKCCGLFANAELPFACQFVMRAVMSVRRCNPF